MGEEQMANTLISSLAFAACVSAFTPEYLTFSAPISQVPRSKTVMQETKLMTPDKLEKAFARFDVDGSGQVDLDEFTYKMKTLDMPFNDFELEQMFNEMDASANGGMTMMSSGLMYSTMPTSASCAGFQRRLTRSASCMTRSKVPPTRWSSRHSKLAC